MWNTIRNNFEAIMNNLPNIHSIALASSAKKREFGRGSGLGVIYDRRAKQLLGQR